MRIREKIVEAHLPTEGPTETGNTANETMESSAVEIWDMTATLAGCTAIFLVQLVVAIRATAEVFSFRKYKQICFRTFLELFEHLRKHKFCYSQGYPNSALEQIRL